MFGENENNRTEMNNAVVNPINRDMYWIVYKCTKSGSTWNPKIKRETSASSIVNPWFRYVLNRYVLASNNRLFQETVEILNWN